VTSKRRIYGHASSEDVVVVVAALIACAGDDAATFCVACRPQSNGGRIEPRAATRPEGLSAEVAPTVTKTGPYDGPHDIVTHDVRRSTVP
jgi:hypothetical protein